MNTFFMLGKYSPKGLRGIDGRRTRQIEELIGKSGGKLVCGFALLGEYDVVLVVELPNLEKAMRTAVAISQTTGLELKTSLAIPFSTFDQIVEDLATEIESIAWRRESKRR